MTIRFQCSNCQASLKVKDELAGRRVRCKACNSVITIPQPADDLDDFSDLIIEAVDESPEKDLPLSLPAQTPQRKKGKTRRKSSEVVDSELSQAALWSVILGALALLCCGFLAGIPAVVAGIIALVNIGNSRGALHGKGVAITGMVLGIAGPVLTTIIVLNNMGGIEGLLAKALRNSPTTKTNSRNNLKQIGLALHNYDDTYGTFPPGGVFDSRSIGHHGWQTFLLPYLDKITTYNRIDFNIPWNDPKNATSFQTEIREYLVSNFEEKKDAAGYAVSHYAGNSHLFGKNTRLRIQDIKDGTMNTLFVGEAAGNYKPWGHPENWRDPANGIGQGADSFGNSSGAQFVMTDGSVRSISASINPDLLRALATPAGGEVIAEDIPP